jgi:P27 family predicted phage terminase small subunit
LDKEAKREWRKISIELFKIGLLTMIDRAALAAYCQSYSTWVSAQEKTNHYGQYVSGSKKNTLVIAPWVRLANESLVQMKMFLCEFGLTPSSRTRLEVKSQEEKSLEELLA